MKQALREVTAEEIETFWRDGIVCLRKILDPQLLHDMEEPVAQLVGTSGVADLSAMGDAIAASGQDVQRGDVPTTGRGRFLLVLIIGSSIRAFGISHVIRYCLRLPDK